MNKGFISVSLDNSIRSLFQMIAVMHSGSGECVIVDQNRELKNISDHFGDMAYVSFDEMCRSLIRNVHPEDREEFILFTARGTYTDALRDHVHISIECRIRHSDNRYYWSEFIMCNSHAEDSTEGDDLVILIRDIDERKTKKLCREAAEREVLRKLRDKYDALFEENMTDQQTGCYNRKGLNYYTDLLLDEAKQSDRDLFVCVADLNGLKHLNDTYGHAAGDEALKVVSRELIKAAPAGTRPVRIGGDEFLLFALLDKESREPEEFADKIDRAIKEYNETSSNPYQLGVSYGWVFLPVSDGMINFDEYIEMADKKMYEMRLMRDKHRRN